MPPSLVRHPVGGPKIIWSTDGAVHAPVPVRIRRGVVRPSVHLSTSLHLLISLSFRGGHGSSGHFLQRMTR